MKVVFYLIYCLIDFYILFGLYKYNFNPKAWYMFLPPIFIVIPILLIGLIAKCFEVQWNRQWADLLLAIMISSLVVSTMIFFKVSVPKGLDSILDFHRTYNSQNLGRNPIKFFITYRKQIELAFYSVAFIASLLMLYGIYWGSKK